MNTIRRGMPWNFWWKSNGLPRPNNPLDEATRFQVYNITDEEFKQNNRIIGTSSKKLKEPLVYLCSVKNDQKPETFDIILKNEKIYYSIARSRNRGEAQQLYTRLKALLPELLPYGPKSRKELEMAAFLQELVLFSNKHPEFSHVPLAARMGLAQPFEQKLPNYIGKLNEQIPPLKATLLILAVLSDREDIVAAILNLKPNLTLLDTNNASALHYAASSSNPLVFKIVLYEYTQKYGFGYLRKRNIHGLTPFHISCYFDRRENTLQLLELGLPIDILNASRPENLFLTNDNQSPQKSQVAPISEDELKRQQATRVTLTRQMLEDLEWSEIKLGGTPLHWVTRRRTLDALLQYQFPTDSMNFNRESVIHVMIRRKRLRCLIILLSNGYKPTLMARRRLTPLHYAILDEAGLSDITLVQLLVVYDADLNASANGQTPRHMTQNILDPEARSIVLYILHSVGAARCPRKIEKTRERKSCYDGCAPDGDNNGKQFKGLPPLEGQSLYAKYLIDNIVKNRREKGSRVNMLCCDGGGTRGILAVQMLIELQKHLQQPLHHYFHWLSGTSTGSFIAAYLALKRTPEDIRRHYVTLKDNIFAGERPYSTTTVEKFLKNILPEHIKMRMIKDKKLIITAVQADCSPVQLHLFRNYQPPDDLANRLPISDQNNVPVWYACRASGAAPSYFRPRDEYIDGGLIANNPTLDTMTDFYMYNKALESVDRGEECQELGCVISIGTGRWPIIYQQEPLNVGKMSVTAPRQSYNQAIALVTTLSIVSSMTDNYIVDRAQTWCSTLNVPYFRLSPPISEQLPLDVKSDSELVNAMYETKAFCHHFKDDFKLLAAVLEESVQTPQKVPSTEKAMTKSSLSSSSLILNSVPTSSSSLQLKKSSSSLSKAPLKSSIKSPAKKSPPKKSPPKKLPLKSTQSKSSSMNKK